MLPRSIHERAQAIHGSGSPAVEDQTSFSSADPGFCNMLTHGQRLLLLPGILSGFLVQFSTAAPLTHDQSQTGEYNVDAKFENFLVILAESGYSDLLSQLATQALEFQSLASRRGALKGGPSETTVYETGNVNRGKEPYHVEIVHIEREGEADAKNKAPGTVGEEKRTSLKDLEEEPSQVVSIDGKKLGKKTRSLWKNEESHGLVDARGRESKQLVDAGYSIRNLFQSDDLAVKEEVFEATKPGISLKKQLSRKEEEYTPLTPQERNELGVKSQELVLLGDGLENCGPGMYRDQLGICQKDEDFN